jgi:hypothetical protein
VKRTSKGGQKSRIFLPLNRERPVFTFHGCGDKRGGISSEKVSGGYGAAGASLESAHSAHLKKGEQTMFDSYSVAFGVTIVIASAIAFAISWNLSLQYWLW